MEIKSPRIAFLIIAHSDAPLLKRLCHQLREHAVFIHIDAKAVDFPVDQFNGLTNVTLVQPRLSVHWADFSMIEATLAMLKMAAATGEVFSKYVLLSGACYPVKPLPELAALFASDGDRNYIRFTQIKAGSTLRNLIGRHWRMAPLIKLDGFGKSHPLRKMESLARVVLNKLSSKRGRHFEDEHGAPAYFGSQWWALSDPAVRFLLEKIARDPKLLNPFRSVYAPDEIFFHTLMGNSPFVQQSEGLQEDKSSATNQYAPLHMIHPSQDRVFGRDSGDFELVRGTEKFFIRKISSKDSGALLDRIDAELLQVV